MRNSLETLALPSSTARLSSQSPSPAPRNPSRSPHPYRRKNPSRKRRTSASSPNDTQSSQNSSPGTPLQGISYSGEAESGTEADDELTRRLTAPPGRRRRLSDDDVFGAVGTEGNGWVGRKEVGISKKPGGRLYAAIARRIIEVTLAMILAVLVSKGKNGKYWEASMQQREIVYWAIACSGTIALYPLRILLRGHGFRLPRSFDPAPLIYPILYPVLVAFSACPEGAESLNPYLLLNLVISLSNLPPGFTGPWQFHWLLSLSPLIPYLQDGGVFDIANEVALVPLISSMLTFALTNLLYPSLTASELRLASGALINLLWHAQSPQALVLRAMIWGGGIAVYLLCEDPIRWNISLARVPTHKFRTAGVAVLGINRFRKLASLRKWNQPQQASDSEADVDLHDRKPARFRKRSFFANLSLRQAKIRKVGYAVAVYAIIFAIIFIGLRPYIAAAALGGIDPFVWAPAYVLCGQVWYQEIIDKWAPGMGYCVTEGSTETADVRFYLVVYWLTIIAIGLTIVTTVAPNIEVDTRRKIFHGMVLPMFLVPGLFDPLFTYLALSIALSLFILIDLIRAGQLPPASDWIARFLQPYVDGRDLKGPMVISHVFLLIGSGIGWWLTLAGHNQRDWEWQGQLELSFVAGVACVGMGDAAASLIGRRFGKTKWGWRGGKSVEGSLAFTVAVMTGLCIGRSYIQGWHGDWGLAFWLKLLFTGVWGSMVEAVATGVNDNVVVPLGVWMMVRALGL